MAGYSPAGCVYELDAFSYCQDYWERFFYTLDWLRYEAPNEIYWDYWRRVGGWPVPKRKQDSWLDRLKHRDTFLGRIAVKFEN